MSRTTVTSLVFAALLLLQAAVPGGRAQALTVDEILTKVEARYGQSTGFSAIFRQESTLKAIGITDHASGTALFKRPSGMRWEYLSPERQEIVTDGTTLWIHRPEENQVMIGGAPAYFGDGKGASFLSDPAMIRKKFVVTLAPGGNTDNFRLKLVPMEKQLDLSEIFLVVSGKTFDVVEIATYNAYGDETRIFLTGFDFTVNPDDSRFTFRIPENVDILHLDEGN